MAGSWGEEQGCEVEGVSCPGCVGVTGGCWDLQAWRLARKQRRVKVGRGERPRGGRSLVVALATSVCMGVEAHPWCVAHENGRQVCMLGGPQGQQGRGQALRRGLDRWRR